MPRKSPPDQMASVESFSFRARNQIERTLLRRNGDVSTTVIRTASDSAASSADAAFDLAWLKSASRPEVANPRNVVRIVDLFAGCGGLSVGIAEAARGLGMRMDAVLANDIDDDILGIYSRNFPEADIVCAPVETLLDGASSESRSEGA
jgi:DNA (cytosine-5)-methyltransferase 1